MKEWEILRERETAYKNDYIELIKDKVRLPSGVEAEFYALDSNDTIVFLALTNERRAILTEQYRPALGLVILELPAGNLKQGESPQEGAKRELREETGWEAEEIVYLGSFYRNPGRDTGSVHAFIGKGFYQHSPKLDRYEWIEPKEMDFEDLLNKVLNNGIKDITTVSAVLMAKLKILRGELTI
jgi:ADP-ribose pyrophosphatase